MSGSKYYGQKSIRPDFLNGENDDPDTDVFMDSFVHPEDTDDLHQGDDDGDGVVEQDERSSSRFSALNSARRNSAIRNLRDTESGATALKNGAGSLAAARSAEKSGFYTGAGKAGQIRKAARTGKDLKKKSRLKNALGGSSFLTIILAVAGLAIAVMFTSISNLGAQWEDLITRATDPSFPSYSVNATRITKEMLAGKRKLPDYTRNRFEKQGINVSDTGSGVELDFDGTKITADNFDDIYRSNVDFREAYTKAKRGRVANFFDDSATKVLAKIGITRNVFSDYKVTGDDAADAANYKNKTIAEFEGGKNSRINTVGEEQETNEDGTPKTDEDGDPVMHDVKNGEDLNADGISGGDKLAKARSYLIGTAGKVADTGSMYCSLLKVGNMISAVVAANTLYQTIHYFMINAENISKMKSGAGDGSAINPFLNFLNTSAKSTYIDPKTNEEKEVVGSPLESPGHKFVMAEEKPDQNITSAFSIEASFLTTGAALALNGYSAERCAGVQAASAVISLATLALPGGGLIKVAVSLAKKALVQVGIAAIITVVLGALIPIIAKSLFTNPAEDTAGIAAGEYLVSGASATNSRIARSSSGITGGDSDAIKKNAKEVAYINSLEAEVERHDRSPFDASSEYTFFGQLLRRIAAIGVTNNTVASTISSALHITGNSLASLGNAYAAESIGVQYQTTFGDCPNLESIGIKGDVYCNPISTADLDIARVASDDSAYLSVLIDKGNAKKNDEGKWEVIDNSDLANYIIYCTERDSPFGIYDANIANAMEHSLGIVGDNLPVLEDFVDIVNAAEDFAYQGWADGTYCGNSDKNPYWDGYFEYFPHFIEDQRICTQMGCEENVNAETGAAYNPVLAFKDKYYEEHPLDNSDAGIISRISGLTKDDAESVIALVDYLNYIAEYTPPKTLASELNPSVADYISRKNREKSKVYSASSLTASTFERSAAEKQAADSFVRHTVEFNTLRDRSFAA